jgi:hypothetical protein
MNSKRKESNVTRTSSLVLRDAEVVELLADEPELLALADAYQATQRRYWTRRTSRRAWARRTLVAAAVAAILAPAAAFADQIGSLLGLYNQGTTVPASAFPSPWVAALVRDPAYGNGHVRQIGQQNGLTFYASKTADGNYCVGVGGLGSGAAPSIDALNCGAPIDSLMNGTLAVEDFSAIDASNGTTTVTRLAGFANPPAVTIAVLDGSGQTLYSTPVVDGLYAATDIPQQPAAAIVGLDASNNIIYRRPLIAPPRPQPATP